MADTWKNKLYFGDNLDVLIKQHFPAEVVDLIYLDPPFNSRANYNLLFREQVGTKSAAQVHAFNDTWHWGPESELAFHRVVTSGSRPLAALLESMRAFLGETDLMAYLAMMAPRLVQLHRVLKEGGSIYLHCDPTASHYLKLIMDAIFDQESFQNEIVWKRTAAHSDAKQGASRYGRVHDVLLFYAKGPKPAVFNPQWAPYDQEYIDAHYRHIEPETGRRYRKGDLTANRPGGDTSYEWHGVRPYSGRYWAYSREKMEQFEAEGRLVYTRTGMPEYKRYLDEMPGRPVQDVWDDIAPLNSQAQERLGYPTQKPEALLERVIRTSSNEGDLVLDPFCGCGTTVAVAERLDRKWIGIDITHLAIALMRHRLRDTFGETCSKYEVFGEPADVASAEALAKDNRHQFEWWAISRLGALPGNDRKKGADAGIDGFINFFVDRTDKAERVIVQVKSGNVTVADIRDLKGVLQREGAAIGVFFTLKEPTKPMRDEALKGGYYTTERYPDVQFPRVQIITVGEMLEGAMIQFPRLTAAPVKKAERKGKEQQEALF